jgi:hypothetical protein
MHRVGAIIFRDLVGKLEVLNFEYDKCGHRGRYRLDRLIMRYGIDAELVDWEPEADCPRTQAKNLNDQCGARCRDLSKVALAGWRGAGMYGAPAPPWFYGIRASLKNDFCTNALSGDSFSPVSLAFRQYECRPMSELEVSAIALMLTTELAVAIGCVAAWFRECVLAAF